MSPIYPINIPFTQISNSSWATASEYADLVLHIKNLCSNYPSLIMAYSADFNAKSYASLIAEQITKWGINVFMPDYPTPLSALSYAITTKSMPIGLYIEETISDESIKIIPLSTHGGLFDQQDLNTSFVSANSKTGVIGSTDIVNSYIKHLSGFADPFIEKGLSFSNFEIPFKEIEQSMIKNDSLKILFERNSEGPKAKLSNNGCNIIIEEKNNVIPTEQIATKIAKYLKEERYSTGTIMVPKGNIGSFSLFGEVEEIEGNSYDLSYSAAFSNLFLGWWPDGIIAMQGSSCFGDGLLAAIYYIESLR